MGLLDPTLLRNLKGLTGLLAETPIGKYVRGKDQGLSVEGLKRGLLSIPVFENTPEANQTAYEAAMNIGPLGLGKIVYHGSPHKFDKFDASKIGTGEGAQAYGHGVYLADAEDVAKEYAAANAGRAAAKSGFLDSLPPGAQVDVMKIMDQKHRGPLARAQLERVKDRLSTEQYEAVVREFDAGGALYKADLPDEWIPKMLDWDKPLSQQPQAVVNGFRQMLKDQKYLGPNDNGPRQLSAALKAWKMERGGMAEKDSGNLFWEAMRDSAGGPDKAAEYFRNSGVPGIRYLDGGSRGKGQGSYNYVVFPGLEDQVKILERNGVPLGLLGGK